jgi:hypothetical protein
MLSPAGIPDGRNMVYVDTQAQMGGGLVHVAYCFRLPGLIAGTAASSGGTSSAS